jgi:pilus assembly protein CpaB
MEQILSSRLFTTRGGTVALGVIAAVMAAVILIAYLAQYRSSVAAAHNPMSVLVADRLIQKGTPGNVIGTEELFRPTTVPQGQLVEGAISDPAILRGRVAVDDIYPGQQLTAADFTLAASNAIGTRIARTQRAISLPIDAARGLIGHIQTGDHVDVFAGFNVTTRNIAGPVVKVIMSDALVLNAPPVAAGGVVASGNANIVLRADYQQAVNLAWAADNGKLWLVLRPPANARPTRAALVDVYSLLFGVKPVVAYNNAKLGRR